MLRKFTAPKEVKRQRERMWAVPLDGGSTADSRVSHCKAHTMQSWFIWFLSLPNEHVVLFPNAAIWRESGLLQCSSVNAEPLWVCGWWWLLLWSHQPAVDHWRGQNTLSWHSRLLVTRIVSSFSVVSLVQDLQSACQFSPSSKHPIKQADWGGSGPYWLGAAQLETGGSWPVGL